MPRGRRDTSDLPPGPATDLVMLFRKLARGGQLNNTSIAARAGLSRSYVGELLNGHKCPSPSTAARFAAAMGAASADVTTARRLAEQLRDFQRFERSREERRTTDIRPVAGLRDICVGFVLALDDAHHGLRECARGRHIGDLASAADQAVHESGIYARRECLLILGSPELAAAGETVFLALVNIRTVIKQGARTDATEYRKAYDTFANAMWAFRGAVRAELSQPALPPQMLNG